MERLGSAGSQLAKKIEDYRKLGAAFDQHRRAAQVIEAHKLLGSPIQAFLDAERERMSSAIKALKVGVAGEMAAQVLAGRKEQLKLLGTVGNRGWITQNLFGTRDFYESATRTYLSEARNIREFLTPQADYFKDLVSMTQGAFSAQRRLEEQAAATWNFTAGELLARFGQDGLISQASPTVEKIMGVQAVYTRLVRETLETINGGVSESIAARLRGSINLASTQLLDLTTSFPEWEGDIDVDEGGRSFLEVPFIQQAELLVSADFKDEDDIETLILASPTAQTSELSREVMVLVTICNEAAKTSTLRGEIFTPTNRVMQVYAKLPWHLSRNIDDFRVFILWLYWVFYEGAGKDNLRFQKKAGGPLEEQDCDFIWAIKHLRDKWLCHDVDHGNERDSKKKWGMLAETFLKLGLNQYPQEPRHFETLQRRLLEMGRDFLIKLSSKLELE